jgi:hypothetical protein
VAELRPIPARALSAEVIVERWQKLPKVDADALRADLDRTIDSAL